jgi:hypothetical protein
MNRNEISGSYGLREETRTAYIIMVRNPQGKMPLWRTNIKISFGENWWKYGLDRTSSK